MISSILHSANAHETYFQSNFIFHGTKGFWGFGPSREYFPVIFNRSTKSNITRKVAICSGPVREMD